MTIKDIARESGYGVGTVSRVLNGRPGVSAAAREKILAVVEKNRFQLNNNAKLLKQRRSESVAIIVKGAGNLLFAGILEEMQGRLTATGKAAAVYYLDEDSDEVSYALRIFREIKPLGFLFLGGDRGNFLSSFGEITCPSVLVTTRGDDLGFPNLSSVSSDDVAGARQAVSCLLEAGHRRLGVIGGQSTVLSSRQSCNTSQLRLMGCIQACRAYGVDFDPEGQTAQTRYSMEGGYEGAVALLERCPDLTALFAMSDVAAVGAIRAVRDRGLRVPEDISVMGYDGIALGEYLSPKLATVKQDQVRMAGRSVALLMGCIDDAGTPAAHELVPHRLVTGESVRKLV